MTLSSTPSTSLSAMPRRPLRRRSSMNSEMYSGERALRLMKCSNAWLSALRKVLSSENARTMAVSYFSRMSSSFCTNSTGSLLRSGSVTSCLPVSLMWSHIMLRTSARPSGTRLNRLYMRARSSYLSCSSRATRPLFSISASRFIWLLIISFSSTAVTLASVEGSRYRRTRSASSASRRSVLARYSGQSDVCRYSAASFL
mmetsp:Transcript_27729/g.70665  ORF Transcript_27729/g.70665 Transcript_27729/m.70665 type:complete len:200 (+) Transcript_27729:1422-2021(+)